MRSPSETFATLPRRGMLLKLAELSSPSPSPRATSAQLLELYRCTRARRSLSPEGFGGLTKKGMRQRLDELGIEAKGSRTKLAEAYAEWYRARDGDGAGDAAEPGDESPSEPPQADSARSSEASSAALGEPEVEAAASEAVDAPEAPDPSEDTEAPAAVAAAPSREPKGEAASEPAVVAREATLPEAEPSSPARSEPEEPSRASAPRVEPGRVSIVPVVRVAGSASPASDDEDEDDIVLSVESLPPEERAELEALFDLDDEPEVAFDTLPPEAREQVMRAVEESSDAAFEIPSVRLRAPAVPALEETSSAATSTPPSAATEPPAEASGAAPLPAEAPARKKKKKKKKKKRRKPERAAVDEPVFVEAAVPPSERRVGDRVPLEVDIGYLSDTNFYQGFSEDLSEGGLFVATVHILPMGQAVELKFVLPGGAEVVAEGRVAWVRQGRSYDSQTQAGMGVAFEKVDSAGEAAIRQYMSVRDPIFYVD